MAKRFKVTNSSKNILLVLIFTLIAVWGIKLKFNRNNPVPQTVQSSAVDTTKTMTAKQPIENTFENQADPKTYTYYMIRTVVVTGIMLALIIAMYLFSRRRFKSDSAVNDDIKVLGRRYLNNKQYLLIVKTGKKKILVGVTDHNINFLTDLDDNEPTENDEESDEVSNQETGTFGSILKKIDITSKELE